MRLKHKPFAKGAPRSWREITNERGEIVGKITREEAFAARPRRVWYKVEHKGSVVYIGGNAAVGLQTLANFLEDT